MSYLTLVRSAPAKPDIYDELRDAVTAWAESCSALADTIRRNLCNGTCETDMLTGIIEQLREDQALLAALQCVLDQEAADVGV
jgi:hypothetical protein